MKKEHFQEIEFPKEVEISLEDNILSVKGPQGNLSREFGFGKNDVKISEGKMTMGNKKCTKREKKMINTITSHIKNMIKGVQNKFEYELKICSSHFPMNVKIEGQKAIVSNFLGEKFNREVKIPEGAEVEIKKDNIIVRAINKEIAGQAAANLERATSIKSRDNRIFQDGIYITSKCGVEI